MPTKLVKNDAEIVGDKNMAGAYNDFFVNIGNMVEQKIPNLEKVSRRISVLAPLTQFFLKMWKVRKY